MSIEFIQIHKNGVFLMTKKYFIFSILFAFALLFSATTAKAECNGFYFAGRGGTAKYKVSDHKSNVHNNISNYAIDRRRVMVSGALGYRHDNYRAEIEYVWRRKNSEKIADIAKARFKSHSYMFVVYYDFFPASWFTPFVNAGLGYTHSKVRFHNKTAHTHYSAKDNAFTWSLGAGLSAKITNRLNFDIGYRYYDMGNLSEHSGKTDLSDQEIYAGIRYIL